MILWRKECHYLLIEEKHPFQSYVISRLSFSDFPGIKYSYLFWIKVRTVGFHGDADIFQKEAIFADRNLLL